LHVNFRHAIGPPFMLLAHMYRSDLSIFTRPWFTAGTSCSIQIITKLTRIATLHNVYWYSFMIKPANHFIFDWIPSPGLNSNEHLLQTIMYYMILNINQGTNQLFVIIIILHFFVRTQKIMSLERVNQNGAHNVLSLMFGDFHDGSCLGMFFVVVF
ncbi:hypothetical protein ACJX0J_005537, partial [Zea mays]